MASENFPTCLALVGVWVSDGYALGVGKFTLPHAPVSYFRSRLAVLLPFRWAEASDAHGKSELILWAFAKVEE